MCPGVDVDTKYLVYSRLLGISVVLLQRRQIHRVIHNIIYSIWYNNNVDDKWKLFQTPLKKHWKAASDKEVASLKKNNVYTLVPATAVPAGHKIVGSRWVYKVKADKSYKGRVVVLE